MVRFYWQNTAWLILLLQSKSQVDVKELKELLWHEMEATERDSQILSFQSLLDKVPPRSAAGPVEDISVHTSFICVLHLANEHGLRVTGVPTLSALNIQRDGC